MDFNVREYLYGVEAKQIRLIKMCCEIKEELMHDNITFNIQISTDQKVIDKKKGKVFLSVNITGANAEEEQCLFIEVGYEALCEVQDEMDSNEFEYFLKGQPVPMLWGYARECVDNTTNRMGMKPILLPVLNLTQLISKTVENDSSEISHE